MTRTINYPIEIIDFISKSEILFKIFFFSIEWICFLKYVFLGRRIRSFDDRELSSHMIYIEKIDRNRWTAMPMWLYTFPISSGRFNFILIRENVPHKCYERIGQFMDGNQKSHMAINQANTSDFFPHLSHTLIPFFRFVIDTSKMPHFSIYFQLYRFGITEYACNNSCACCPMANFSKF